MAIKQTLKQKIRVLVNAANKAEKVYTKARTEKYKATKACDDAWKIVDTTRMKLARQACPFKQQQIVKYWNGGYVKITEITDMSAGEIKPPLFQDLRQKD